MANPDRRNERSSDKNLFRNDRSTSDGSISPEVLLYFNRHFYRSLSMNCFVRSSVEQPLHILNKIDLNSIENLLEHQRWIIIAEISHQDQHRTFS